MLILRERTSAANTSQTALDVDIDMCLMQETVKQISVFITLTSDLRRGSKSGVSREVLDVFFLKAPLSLHESLSYLATEVFPASTELRPMELKAEELLCGKECVCFLTGGAGPLPEPRCMGLEPVSSLRIAL